MKKFKIFKGDAKKYIELNGTKSLNTPCYNEILEGKRVYYYVEKDGKFYYEFYTYPNSNELGIFYMQLADVDFMRFIFSYLKDKMTSVVVSVPEDALEHLDFVVTNYNVIGKSTKRQGIYKYILFEIKL